MKQGTHLFVPLFFEIQHTGAAGSAGDAAGLGRPPLQHPPVAVADGGAALRAGLSIGLTAAGAEGSVPPVEGLPPTPGFSGSVGFSG